MMNAKDEERQQTLTELDDQHDMNQHTENDMLIPSGTTDADVSAKKRSKKPPTASDHHSNITSNMDTDNGDNSTNEKLATSKKRNSNRNKRLSASSTTAMETIIKYVALVLLVGQMVGLVLLMRYSRTVPRPPDVPLYLASTAVFVMEFMKLFICLFVILIQSGSLGRFIFEMNVHIIQSPIEIAKLCVPSLLYTIQNNLLYLALSNLDAATYQVCYQLKILTTAIFSAILLNRKFSSLKWLSLVILTIGVAIVELSGSGDQHTSTDTMNDNKNGTTTDLLLNHTARMMMSEELQQHQQTVADVEKKNHMIGIIAVICAACTSGFSGVYFEKILKGSSTSLWIRNVQMGLPSIIIAYITVYWKDSIEIHKYGFLGGYTNIVWTVVIVQAVGGLIVATVVKYADNVLKVFATSFSIVISCIISSFMFHFRPNTTFIIGASLVVVATALYSSPEKTARRKALLPLTNKTRK